MRCSTDSIVMGGGVVGMLTARELAIQGEQVMLIDSHQPGTACSWAGGGILSPLFPWQVPDELQPLVTLSQSLYPDLVACLIEETGIDPEYVMSGLLILDRESQARVFSWSTRQGITCHKITMRDPHNKGLGCLVSPDFDSGIYLPGVAQVRNPRLIKALLQSLEQWEVRVIPNEKVRKINTSHDKFRSVETDAGIYQAEKAVVACGAWSSLLLPEIMVYPVKGQMLCLYDKAQSINHIVLHQDTYVIPRLDGHVLIGSTLEETGFNNNITQRARMDLYKKVVEIIPSIKQFQFIKQWAGLRPAIKNNIPLIGAYSPVEGLYLNTGHYRNGLLLAAGSARILSEIMLSKSLTLAIDPFQYKTQRQVSSY